MEPGCQRKPSHYPRWMSHFYIYKPPALALNCSTKSTSEPYKMKGPSIHDSLNAMLQFAV